MARGRMLNKRISLNKKVNTMSDRAQLLYTWAIAHLDKNGVIHGDPIVVKSTVIPRRDDITSDDVESYIREWVAADLVIWYEHEDDQWLQFPTFADNQTGMRADREPDTGNPVYTTMPEDCRKIAGSYPEDIPPKGREEKGREENTTRAREEPVCVSLPVVVERWPEQSIEKAAVVAFQKTNPVWSDQRGNLDAINRLVGLCRIRGDPATLVPKAIELYTRLVAGEVPGMSDGDRKFWGRQPLTPKGLVQIWERFEAYMRGAAAEHRKDEAGRQFAEEAAYG